MDDLRKQLFYEQKNGYDLIGPEEHVAADNYCRGGGRLPWWAVSMSIYATMFSSITFLSIPALSFLTDCRYFALARQAPAQLL